MGCFWWKRWRWMNYDTSLRKPWNNALLLKCLVCINHCFFPSYKVPLHPVHLNSIDFKLTEIYIQLKSKGKHFHQISQIEANYSCFTQKCNWPWAKQLWHNLKWPCSACYWWRAALGGTANGFLYYFSQDWESIEWSVIGLIDRCTRFYKHLKYHKIFLGSSAEHY